MYEIEFEGWDEEKKKMYDMSQLGYIMLNDIYMGTLKEKLHCILRQYIGRKDKNGKKIFNGDILKRLGGTEPLFLVTFNEELLAYCVEENRYLHYYNSDELEIIGDIYRNPELLKEVEECE